MDNSKTRFYWLLTVDSEMDSFLFLPLAEDLLVFFKTLAIQEKSVA